MPPFFALLLAGSCLLSVPVFANPTLQESTLDTYYEPRETPPMERKWVKGLIFGGGGFLTGFVMLRLLRVARRRSAPPGVLLAASAMLFSTAPPARACINVEEKTIDAIYSDFTDTGWFTGTVRNALKANPADHPQLKADPTAYGGKPAPGVLESDEAARMIMRGNAAGALVKLRHIEAAHPGLYQVAANMGTAYELTGEEEKALEWIKTGIRLNPNSHMLAEWLHVKILEAKIELKRDPAWLEKHNITGLKPRAASFETLQGIKSARGILESMRSQATVRAIFIKPTDVILAHLLREAAAFAIVADPASVPGILDLAEKYGLPAAQTTGLRTEFERRKNNAIGLRAWLLDSWPWLLFGLCAVLGAFAGARRWRKA